MPTLEHVGTNVVRSEKLVAGSSFTELIAGAAAVVLPILGLVGVLPMSLAAIAFIAIGAAMMINGGALATQAHALFADANAEGSNAEFVGGADAQTLGGAAVVALGILALLRIAPFSLLGIAALVAGASILLGAGAAARLGTFRYGTAELSSRQRELLRESVRGAAGADVLVGLGSIVLGILALSGVSSSMGTLLTLILVAALVLGGGLFVSGTTTGARMTALLRHT